MTSHTRAASTAAQLVSTPARDRYSPRRLSRLIRDVIAVARDHGTPRRPPVGTPAAVITYHHTAAHQRHAA